ncbi:ribonuclease H-like domain-containing protein [Tanacetum coccineum]
MLNYNPCKTHVDSESKLGPDDDRVEVPTLQYLTFTRPDLSYAVEQICLFMHDPREPHYTAPYSDADWAGCPSTRRSTSGYCVFLDDNLITWSSKRQHVISRSSVEAEYRSVVNAVAATTWVRNLLQELLVSLRCATLVYYANVIKRFWDTIGNDFIDMVKRFEMDAFIPRGCNSSFIALVPKKCDPIHINDFRPISLIGCQYKVIAKVLANRLLKVVHSVVSDVQTAYIKGRQIVYGPLMVNEIISWASKKKERLFVLKVDFEKAFDSLN